MRSISWWTVLVLWALIVVLWGTNRPRNAFSWDSFAYHLYLPVVIQHHDLRMDDPAWVEDMRLKYDASPALYQLRELPGGKHVIKVSLGLAVLWSPWYLLGHGWALATGAEADGYSMPYQLAVQCGVLLYVLIGLLWLRAVLLRLAGEAITALVMVLLIFGTNYIDQAMGGLTVPHITLFTLYAGILFFTQRWAIEPQQRSVVPLAICLGLAVLSRPSELVCILIPFCWGAVPSTSFRELILRNWRLRKQWAIIVAVMFVIGLPQLLYWEQATGHLVFNSYGGMGEGFDFGSPHTIDFLFSFRKGWFVYTPLMALAVLGLWKVRRHFPDAGFAVIIFFIANLYVVSSWSCWWYADSFSSRAMVQSYPVLAIPLAGLFRSVRDGGWRRWGLYLTVFALAGLNLFQYAQFRKRIIHSSRMTKTAYLHVLGRLEAPPDLEQMLLISRSDREPSQIDSTQYHTFELPSSLTQLLPRPGDILTNDTVVDQVRMHRVDRAHTFSPAVRIPINKITQRDHAYLTIEWTVLLHALNRAVDASLVATFERDHENYGYHAIDLAPHAVEAGGLVRVNERILTPDIRKADDPLVLYLWSRDTVALYVSDPRITVFEPLFDL
jgi:hypothetical protein